MKILILFFFLSFTFVSGSKNDKHSCYEKSIVHYGPCTTDCPGFTGCDGESYCKDCLAGRVGIGAE